MQAGKCFGPLLVTASSNVPCGYKPVHQWLSEEALLTAQGLVSLPSLAGQQVHLTVTACVCLQPGLQHWP
jgi:hypothetical protein